ncbi:hypothetical protein GGS21DRAFT_539788 [Xylaria nigripes]|nr:hypothetical protein GGS21DRAFT_539788 [Xylaria nigripes]
MSGEAAKTFPSPGRSVLEVENHPTISPPAFSSTKPRSCVVCRTRKVRCDKRSPCSNCRRANIHCVLPSAPQTPRWAKNYNAATGERSVQAAQALDHPTTQLIERLRNLEKLVKDLRNQLGQAHSSAPVSTGGSPAAFTHGHGDHQVTRSQTPRTDMVQPQFGRLVINDDSHSRYVSNGFWSRVTDELEEIKMEMHDLAAADYGSSEEDEGPDSSPSNSEFERGPLERHSFLFRHKLNSPGPDLAELHPLPSQVPFLLDVFAETVNLVTQIVHMPTIRNLARTERSGNAAQLTIADEALLFSIYYAAIASMGEDEVVRSFRTTRAELSSKYRLGLELALAKADFLNVLDIVLLQAFTIFLFLARRHDSPRYVWMMTSLAIRIGQGLGLQRDGTYFKHLTPFEVEMRRRVWYGLCALDVRASEDQGTDFAIQYGTFDTQVPKNINDADIEVQTKEAPKEREGLTDSTICIVTMEISNISRQMLLPGNSLEEQRRIIRGIFDKLEDRYLRFSTESGNDIYRGLVITTRLIVAKLTLLAHLPVLFSSPSERFSDGLRDELFVAALGVAELNHSLNADKTFHKWRWIFQTYTQWHAIVYLLLDICRRPWSPFVERAWVALHSSWLIPARSKLDKDLQTWVPVRQLMLKAQKHRNAELERLRSDATAARLLEIDDRKFPAPWSVGGVSNDPAAGVFQDRWRGVVGLSHQPTSVSLNKSTSLNPEIADTTWTPGESYPNSHNMKANDVEPQPISTPIFGHIQSSAIGYESRAETRMPLSSYGTTMLDQSGGGAINNGFLGPTADWFDGQHLNDRQVGWLWTEADTNMDTIVDLDSDMDLPSINFDSDGGMDWNNWVEYAKGIERDSQTNR